MLSTRVMDISLKYACLEHNEALNITEKKEVLARCQRREFGLESVDIARIDALFVLVCKKPERPYVLSARTYVFPSVFVRQVQCVR